MRIYSSNFSLEILIVHESGQEQAINYHGNMPQRVVIPIQIPSSDPAIVKSVKLNNIHISKDKLPNVVNFKLSNRKWHEPTLKLIQSGDLIFDLFSVNPILYLLTIENTID